jgi:tetratricopeptide (TPR) repeat protein
MGKAIGYVRVLADMFSDQDGAEAQKLRLTIWARETGYTLEAIVEEIAAPANGMGPMMQQTLSRLKASDVLVVDRVTVAAPNLNDWAGLYDRLHQAGVAIAVVSDGFDTLPGNPAGAQVARALRSVGALPRRSADPELSRLLADEEEDTVNPRQRYMDTYSRAGKLAKSGREGKAIDVWRSYLGSVTGETAGCGWNCVGDIQVKQHAIKEAITSFMRSAHAFETDGYPDRALAILGKVRRNAPERADVFIHQARLSTQLSRMGDALAAYLAYARTQVDANNYQNALDTFGKIRLLNPVDPQFRLGMAKEMRALGFHEDAVKEIICAAELLIEQNDHQTAQMVLSRIQGSDNKDIDRLMASIERNEADLAAGKTLIQAEEDLDFLTPAPDIYHPAQFGV